jgi:D-lyxose ketol-isomerase
MKRSEINTILLDAKNFMAEKCFVLPPWAYWSVDDWRSQLAETTEIRNNFLGWDITDFGLGDFKTRGLFLFTIRNGKLGVDKKPYAEKIMIVEEDQETPMHFHWSKMEDIINRGGGNLVIELFNSKQDESMDTTDVHFKTDGIQRSVKAGGKVILKPGESITLEQGMYHCFYGESGKGKVLVGEVSAVNDDASDNCFFGGIGRFPTIEEDEKPIHLLVGDYGKFLV